MIGYYIHHQGSGHRHRASSVNRLADVELTGLSTGPRPAGWTGPWVDLPDDAGVGPEQDVTAHGRLHYVPLGSRGLSARMAMIAAWIDTERPEALVVDVSVEVAVLARLHGVPVVVVAQPGHREDAAHRLGYDVASRIIAPWPQRSGDCGERPPRTWSRPGSWAGSAATPRSSSPSSRAIASAARRVVVVNGTGGRGSLDGRCRGGPAGEPGMGVDPSGPGARHLGR